MKKILLTIVLLVSLTASAQKEKWEKIKALKVAFITEELNLTEKESQQFWPIHNAFEEEMNKIRHHEMRAIRKEIRDNAESLTNERAKTLIKKYSDAEDRMFKLKQEFLKKISNILPPKKIVKLKIAEDDFKRRMLQEFKKRKKERP